MDASAAFLFYVSNTAGRPAHHEEHHHGAAKEKAPKADKPKQDKPAKQEKEVPNELGVTVNKDQDFSGWYTQAITKAEMIEYYDISGCYVLRPWAYSIWESIQGFLDGEFKKSGVSNAYFPLLVSKRQLELEKAHVEGFAPEVAWVTRSGDSELAEPVAIRPTSETIMYPCYAKWIRSHRDMPLRLNQWCNVIRWEFKHPVPFLRTREFLWQEGHSAFATRPEAEAEVLEILEIYKRAYEELLAIPVTKGKKSEGEKFAGGFYTTTCEAFIPATGRGIQACTSHCLGQNFSKMFGIEFEGVDGTKQLAWQNSWGFTTRSIGVLIMVHGDNKGLVLPPRVAPTQVVVVPIPYSKGSGDDGALAKRAQTDIVDVLRKANVRTQLDARANYTPGWKYNHWEAKGVPVTIQFGPKDNDNGQCVAVRRDTGAKETIALAALATRLPALLQEIQDALLAKARAQREGRVTHIRQWEEFVPALDKGNLVLAPWCEAEKCEDSVKKRSGEKKAANEAAEAGFRLTGAAKSLCIPFEQPALPTGAQCFACEAHAKSWTLFGRSY